MRFSWLVVTAWLVQLKLPVIRILPSIRQYLLCMCAILLLSVVQGTPKRPNRQISAPLNLLHSSSEITRTFTPFWKTKARASESMSFVKAKTHTSTVYSALLITCARSLTFWLWGKNMDYRYKGLSCRRSIIKLITSRQSFGGAFWSSKYLLSLSEIPWLYIPVKASFWSKFANSTLSKSPDSNAHPTNFSSWPKCYSSCVAVNETNNGSLSILSLSSSSAAFSCALSSFLEGSFTAGGAAAAFLPFLRADISMLVSGSWLDNSDEWSSSGLNSVSLSMTRRLLMGVRRRRMTDYSKSSIYTTGVLFFLQQNIT